MKNTKHFAESLIANDKVLATIRDAYIGVKNLKISKEQAKLVYERVEEFMKLFRVAA